jgi:hypothetical protein
MQIEHTSMIVAFSNKKPTNPKNVICGCFCFRFPPCYCFSAQKQMGTDNFRLENFTKITSNQ